MSVFNQNLLDALFKLIVVNLEHDELNENSKFIFGNNGHRLVKKIIQCSKTSSEANQKVLEGVLEGLIQVIVQNMKAFLQTKGIFIIIAILENSDFKESLEIILKKYQKVINELPENAGVQVLKKILG